MSANGSPAFASPGLKTPHSQQPYKIHFPLPPDLQPNLLAHLDLRISIFTKLFFNNHILNKPLSWIGSQTLRITSDSLVRDTSQPENLYTILPIAISATPYFLPIMIVEDIARALTGAQAIDIIGSYQADLNGVDGILSKIMMDSLQSPYVALGMVKKSPNFNWIQNPGGNDGMGIVIEVYTGKTGGEAVGSIYCGPGSIYNEAWKSGGAGNRKSTIMEVKGIKKAIAVIERAKTKHGYPISFAFIAINCIEVLDRLEGWDREVGAPCFKKRGVWKEILDMLRKVREYGVRIEFCESRKYRENMVQGMMERRLQFQREPGARNHDTAVVEPDSIQWALYPHSLENNPLAASSEMIVTKDIVLRALPLGVLGEAVDKKEPELRRSTRQRKRIRTGDETGRVPTGLALEPLTDRQTILPGPHSLTGAPVGSSRGAIDPDENIKGSGIDVNDRNGLDYGFQGGKLKEMTDSDVERTFTDCFKDMRRLKMSHGGVTSESVDDVPTADEEGLNMLYQDGAADLVDAREWKRALGSHLAVGKPLRYPWAPTVDYGGIQGDEDESINPEDPVEVTQDSWTQFRSNIQAFREEFGSEMDNKPAYDEDSMNKYENELDKDEEKGFKVPALYQSGGPSPESRNSIRTPQSYLEIERDQRDPEIFGEGEMELKMPEIDMNDTNACTIQPPVRADVQGREAFTRRTPLYNTPEYKGTPSEEWTSEELQTIDDIIEEIYNTQNENAYDNDEKIGDAKAEGEMVLQNDNYPRTRSRSRSLSRLRRKIGDVKLGGETILEEDTVQTQRMGIPGSPGKKRYNRSSSKASRSPVRRITRASRSPVKRMGSGSPTKGFTSTSRIEKPVDRNMAFKGLARAITDSYELMEE
ncbi:hypothetical protein TWF506_000344 [Arthrobotrys conoides]|uniref:Uncharacterized protein n=1 Tax=Arthrobotrys conoides TaxID=74498 RepID=A0AAN8NQS0_9PEZI